MSNNIEDIKDFQEQLDLLSGEISATETFLFTLWDKADFFEKLCQETSDKLLRAQKRCKELQKFLTEKSH